MSLGGGGYRNGRSECRLLEITVISAQDLHRCGRRKVEAYATAWADEAHKLRTQVDRAGRADPTWNDKFVFRVDAAFLRSDTAAITVAVHAARGALSVRREDPVLGVARIVVSTFVRPAGAGGRQVVALQLRRPRSLRPQGILNVAVALLDVNRAHSMPLYYAPGSPDAFALKDLMARPKSMSKIGEGVEAAAALADSQEAFVDLSGPLDGIQSRSIELKERTALESKLERWKTELSPGRREADGGGGGRGAPRRRNSFCLCGSAEWEK